jgi:hypothetical protein
MALSMGFRSLVSLLSAIQATGRLAFAPAGLSPAERASLRWTHLRSLQFSTGSTRRAARFSNSAGLIWPSVE